MIIKAQRGRGSKIHLLLDGEYSATTDAEFWAQNYIADGRDISDEEWDTLLGKINYRKAFNKCADLLSRRDHSVKELREKLLRTVDGESADRAIEKFTEMGYLDDEKFASAYAKHLFETKNASVYVVKQELMKRGISLDIIGKVIDNYDDYDAVGSIIEIIRKKYLSKLSAENGREKVITALMRKGFSYSDIKTALNRIENVE